MLMSTFATTFSLSETARICMVKERMLHKWLAKGLLTPAVAGGKGRGKSHRFSAQQLLGIVTAAVIMSYRGCSRAYAREVIDTFAGMTDSALHQWLYERGDDYSEEATAKWKHDSAILHDHGKRLFADDEELARIIRLYQGEVERAIRQRMALVQRVGLANLGQPVATVSEQQPQGVATPRPPRRMTKK